MTRLLGASLSLKFHFLKKSTFAGFAPRCEEVTNYQAVWGSWVDNLFNFFQSASQWGTKGQTTKQISKFTALVFIGSDRTSSYSSIDCTKTHRWPFSSHHFSGAAYCSVSRDAQTGSPRVCFTFDFDTISDFLLLLEQYMNSHRFTLVMVDAQTHDSASLRDRVPGRKRWWGRVGVVIAIWAATLPPVVVVRQAIVAIGSTQYVEHYCGSDPRIIVSSRSFEGNTRSQVVPIRNTPSAWEEEEREKRNDLQ